MSKREFTCLNCRKEYESYKENSRFCSNECKKEYLNCEYTCDTCGVPMMIARSRLEKIQNGERKGAYCSRECANEANKNSVIKICERCGKDFSICISMSFQKYCSKECYEIDREEKARKNIPRICPICGETFYTERANAIYCSYECSAISQQRREQCTCEYCGKEFERITSEIDKNEHHYCSKTCKILASQWTEHDRNILRQYYKKIPTKQIQNMLDVKRNSKLINAEAIRLGLSQSREWSIEEENVIKNYYSTLPLSQILDLLPNRTVPSIIHKAIELNVKSFFYLEFRYTKEDDEYLRDYYLNYTNEELGEVLHRTPKAIQQRLWKLGLYRPFDTKGVCYKNLTTFVRARIEAWRNHFREECNYTCCLTGRRDNIIVHHCRSFNILMEETIQILNFQLLDNFEDYNPNDLELFVEKFIELQEYYGEYVCVNKDVHKLFHDNYGYGDNTMEQWNEFVEKYKSGYYNL